MEDVKLPAQRNLKFSVKSNHTEGVWAATPWGGVCFASKADPFSRAHPAIRIHTAMLAALCSATSIDAGNATEVSRDWADRNLATNPAPHSPTEPLSASFSSPLAHAASAFLLFISRDICCNPFSLTKSTRFSGVYFPFLPSVITNPNHTGDEGQNQLLSDPPALISQKGNFKKNQHFLGF